MHLNIFKKNLLVCILLLYKYLLVNIKLSLKYNYLSIKYNTIKIKIAIFSRSIKNGGVERQTSLLLNNFNKVKIFQLYLFTIKKKRKK